MLFDLRAMVEAQPGTLKGSRDRALLLVGFWGALRRSELVGLDISAGGSGSGWVERTPDGARVTLRHSKTDQTGAGVTIGIPPHHDPALCPVLALEAWLSAAGLESGPAFRAVTRHGKLGGRLGARAFARVVQAAATAVGLEPSDWAAHSLRRGWATAAAAAGVSQWAIMRHGRWKSESVARGYIAEGSLFRHHPNEQIG